MKGQIQIFPFRESLKFTFLLLFFFLHSHVARSLSSFFSLSLCVAKMNLRLLSLGPSSLSGDERAKQAAAATKKNPTLSQSIYTLASC